jgi:hypothetical protein
VSDYVILVTRNQPFPRLEMNVERYSLIVKRRLVQAKHVVMIKSGLGSFYQARGLGGDQVLDFAVAKLLTALLAKKLWRVCRGSGLVGHLSWMVGIPECPVLSRAAVSGCCGHGMNRVIFHH